MRASKKRRRGAPLLRNTDPAFSQHSDSDEPERDQRTGISVLEKRPLEPAQQVAIIPPLPDRFGGHNSEKTTPNRANQDVQENEQAFLRVQGANKVAPIGDPITHPQSDNDSTQDPDQSTFYDMQAGGMHQTSLESKRYRDGLAQSANDLTGAEYDKMPVETFGRALLLGMGWNQGVGEDGAASVQVVEFVPRPHLLGLSATPVNDEVPRFIKPGESRDDKDKIYIDRNGRRRHVKPLDDKLVPGQQVNVRAHNSKVTPERVETGEKYAVSLRAGSCVQIIRGQHKGECGCVLSVGGLASNLQAQILVNSNSKKILISVADVRLKNEERLEAGEPASERMQLDEMQPVQKDEVAKRRKRRKHKKQSSWVCENLLVRVIDKEFGGGYYYRRKGWVVDASDLGGVSLRMEEGGSLLEGVPSGILETVVPKEKASLLRVVSGEAVGRLARVVHREQLSSRVSVEFADSPGVVSLSLDSVCSVDACTAQ